MIRQFAWGLLVITTFLLFLIAADGDRHTPALPLQTAIFIAFVGVFGGGKPPNTAELKWFSFSSSGLS